MPYLSSPESLFCRFEFVAVAWRKRIDFRPSKNAHTIYSKLAGLNLHLQAPFREKTVEKPIASAILKESCGKLVASILEAGLHLLVPQGCEPRFRRTTAPAETVVHGLNLRFRVEKRIPY